MFNSISDWIASNITEPLQELILDTVNAFFITMLNSLVDIVMGVMQKEAELAKSLIEAPYITQAVKYSITLALTLLAVRIGFEAFQNYIAYSTGEEAHPTELLKKSAIATAVIVSIPWITKQILIFSFSIVDDINQIQTIPDVTTLGEAMLSFVFIASGTSLYALLILLIISLVLWLILLIQLAVRAVNIAMLMIIGPWMWAFQNELGKTWFKAVFSQCFAIPIQLFMLRGAVGSFLGTYTQGLSAALLFLGFLWAAIKFPTFLQQLVAQTGVGGAIGGTTRSAGTAVFIRRMAIRR